MVCDHFYVIIFKSLRFHLSTLEMERFQNLSTFETVLQVSVFIGIFERFSVDEYAFSNENALVWMGS